jgi:dolichyl-phosphate beta-glucosyltransferase
MKPKNISVIIPCFNEGKTIRQNISAIHHHLSGRFDVFEIIAVNDGSIDNTLNELKKIHAEFDVIIIDNPINQGKGNAVKDGIIKSRFETVMFLDADLGIPIEELDKFLMEMDNDYDLVIASRFVPGLRVVRPVSWHRKIMERVFRFMRMVILNNYDVLDTQCGFKVFRRKAALEIFHRQMIKRFAFDAELIFIAKKLKYKIKELPISLQNPPKSHVRLLRDPLNMFLDLLRIRKNEIRGAYRQRFDT